MNTSDLTLEFGTFLYVGPKPKIRKTADHPDFRGLRIILGRPLPGDATDCETRDLEVM